MIADQIAEGRRRESLGGAWTSYVDDDSTVTEVRSLDEGLERLRAEAELERLEPFRRLVSRIENPTFEDTFQAIFDEALDLLIERQRKYGPNNIAQQGMWGVLTRIADDKISRLKRAFNGSVQNGEVTLDPIPEGTEDDTFEDACLDVMNYAAILLALKRGEWGRPLADGSA